MIGVSIKKLRFNDYASEEFFYQCPYCGKDQYFLSCPAYLCAKCGKMIDSVERLFHRKNVVNRLTFHMGGIHQQFMRFYPYNENNIKIVWK